MSNQASDSYLLAVQKALLSFQMLEEALKICVGVSYEIIAKKAPAPIVFQFDPRRINNASLGSLIGMFSKLNGNTKLIDDLEKVVAWRNFCAHNAFAHEFLDRASASPFAKHEAEDIEIISKSSVELVERVGNELKAIRELHRSVFGDSAG